MGLVECAAPSAHAVTTLVLRIEPGGRVLGRSADNGCELVGRVIPSKTRSATLNLDVNAARCVVAALNRRYSGTLLSNLFGPPSLGFHLGRK